MGNGFSVDPDMLDFLASRLGDIRDQIKGVEAEMLRSSEEAVGDEGIASELREVADNWTDKREELREDIDRLSACATDAAKCYRETDEYIGHMVGGPEYYENPNWGPPPR